MHPVMKANAAWEAKAIEKCRSDPRVYEAGLCYICMRTPGPNSGCTHFRTVEEARAAMDVKK